MRSFVENSTADKELLVAEVTDQFIDELKQGRSPSIDAYAEAYPEIAGIIRQVFPALALLDASQPATQLQQHDCNSVSGQLGDFRILQEIGRGGMGVVYEAEQISIGRRVALKVLPFAPMLDKQQLNRFKNEARAAGTLDHPNIVSVITVGTERGVHYYAMQLVEGQSLAEVIAERRRSSSPSPPSAGEGLGEGAVGDSQEQTHLFDSQPLTQPLPSGERSNVETRPVAALSTVPNSYNQEYFRTVAQLGIQAAEGLDHAHQNGIVHRDVKPGNLLVDDEAKLYVADFGLARIETEAGMTMTGDLLGTLRYMSPEQALARRAVVDHRTDIYSLGATLYELLTLQPAYHGGDRQELLKQIAFEEPKKLRQHNARIPVDLETIVAKAMEKNPHDRYATAKELAEDLRCFTTDQPIKARPPTLFQRTAKWSRRHVGMVWTVACAALLFAIAGAVGAGVLSHARNEARVQASVATTEKQEALRNLYRASVQIAHSEWKLGRIDRAEKELREAQGQQAHIDFRRWEWYFVRALCRQGKALDGYLIKAPPGCPVRLLAQVSGETTTLVNMESGEVALSLTGDYDKLCLNSDGTKLAAIFSFDGPEQLEVRVYDLATRSVMWHQHAHHDQIISWSSDENTLLCGPPSGPISVLDAKDGGEKTVIARIGSGRWIRDCIWSHDGESIALLLTSDQVEVWSVNSGQRDHLLDIKHEGIQFDYGEQAIAWEPNGNRLAVTGRNSFQVWLLNEEKLEQQVVAHRGPICQIAWSPDGRSIATCGLADSLVKLWDPDTGQQQNEFLGHKSMIYSLNWLNDDELATKSSRRRTIVWRRNEPPQPFVIPSLGAAAWTPAGSLITATNAEQPRCTLYDAKTRSIESEFTGDAWRNVTCLAVAPTDRRIATGHSDGSLKTWSRKTGKRFCQIEAFPKHTRCISWSPDGKMLAASGGGTKNPFRVFNSETGEEIAQLSILSQLNTPYGGISWSPDGTLLAGYKTQEVRVWCTDTWAEVFDAKTGDGGDSFANGISWSPRGEYFATVTGEYLNIWDMRSRRHAARIRCHIRETNSVSWAPDGSRIATGGDDHLIKIWNVETGECMLTLDGHTNTIRYLAWSPDGRKLVSASNGETLLWDASKGYQP